MNIAIFWDVALCSLVDTDACQWCLLPSSLGFLDVEGSRLCETSIIFYQTTWRSIPKDSRVHILRREDLMSQQLTFCI
jgi:hypothetical protein